MAALRLRSKRMGWLKAALAIAFLNLVVGTGLYLTSAGFEDDMRRLLIGQLEQTTGCKTELKEFHWNLSRLELEGRDVTIHGTEHAGQAPYFHADHILLRLRVLSLFQRNIGLRELFAEHPVIHIMVARDGSTNQPVPRVKQNPKEPVDELFNLGVERVQIAHGELLWNEQKMPLDLTANDVTARLQYLRAQQQFEGWLSVGKIDGVYGKFRPVAGTADLHLLLARDPEVRDPLWDTVASRLTPIVAHVVANPPVLIHSDFWFGNTIWQEGRLTGIIDWDGARIADPARDVASARNDLALLSGARVADVFLARYVSERGPLRDLAFWDLVSSLPPIRWLPHWVEGYTELGLDLSLPAARARLESWIADALDRL